MFDFEKRLTEIGQQTILCIGDLMLDDFVYGDVSRISPEAPAPVIRVSREDVIVGGAGNVARNIASLGAKCLFVGVIGDDVAGHDPARGAEPEQGARSSRISWSIARGRRRGSCASSPSIIPTHLLRADWEIDATGRCQDRGGADQAGAGAAAEGVGAVVLSDYAKGVLTPKLIRAVIERAKKLGKPVIVDPKGSDFSIYRGATIITPNRKELAEATHRPVDTGNEIAAAAKALAGTVGSKAVLVTLSEEGMLLLHARDRRRFTCRPISVRVRDVSGAGDTVAAVLAVMLALDADFESAMRAANAAASVVVGKSGTATVSAAELRARILPAGDARPRGEDRVRLARARCAARRNGARRISASASPTACSTFCIPATSRCWRSRAAACDRLVVGLNSDASVKRLKGKDRPIQTERARAEVLAGLEAVDLVVVFEQDTPLELIREVRPTRSGQGRRLQARSGGRARGGQGAGRRGDRGRSGAGLQHHADRREVARAQEQR